MKLRADEPLRDGRARSRALQPRRVRARRGRVQGVVTAAAGDNRALAPALKDLGRTQAKAHKNAEALATLKKALAVSGAETAVRAEIYEIITEIYRADQQLPVLIKQLEDEHPTDFARLALLGALYEETGDGDKAHRDLQAGARGQPAADRPAPQHGAPPPGQRRARQGHRRVRGAHPRGAEQSAVRLRAVRGAAAARRPRRAPHARQRARGARRAPTRRCSRASPTSTSASARRTARSRCCSGSRRSAASDPGHLVDLGDRYFQDGNTPLAVQTWKRILDAVQPRAQALAALGDVYLEHDMTADALAAFGRPSRSSRRTWATRRRSPAALERTQRYREAAVALRAARGDSAKEKGDKALAREAARTSSRSGASQHIARARRCPALRSEFAGDAAGRRGGAHARRGAAAPPPARRRRGDAAPRRRARARRRRELPRARARARAGEQARRRDRGAREARRRSIRSARASSTSAWRSTRSRSTTTTTPSSTRRAPSS